MCYHDAKYIHQQFYFLQLEDSLSFCLFRTFGFCLKLLIDSLFKTIKQSQLLGGQPVAAILVVEVYYSDNQSS